MYNPAVMTSRLVSLVVTAAALAVGAASVASCSRSPASSETDAHHHGGETAPAASRMPGQPTAVTGRERFAWTQPLDSAQGHRFAVYADGVRMDLPKAVCHAPVSGQAECDSPLPPLTDGKHSLEVVSITDGAGRVLESARSAPILIVVSGAAASAPPRNH
jgi:hypothetical protein